MLTVSTPTSPEELTAPQRLIGMVTNVVSYQNASVSSRASNSSSDSSLNSDKSKMKEVVGQEGKDKVQVKQAIYDITKRAVAFIKKLK